MTITKQPVLTSGLIALSGIIAEDKTLPQRMLPAQCFHPSSPLLKTLSKLLLNAWSAEYALRITPIVDETTYRQDALHWTFPQAYYGALFSSRAFLTVNGYTQSDETVVYGRISDMVVRGYYPASLSFYTIGAQGQYRHCNIIDTPKSDSKSLITELLTSTRDRRMHQLRSIIQNNPKTALRNAAGEVIQKFGPEQYKALSKNAGRTTFFNLLRRLRISNDNRDVEALTGNIRDLHNSLVNILNAVNLAHERQIYHALGRETYESIIQALPSYLQENFVDERLKLITNGCPVAD